MSNPALRLVFWELTAQCNLQCQHCRAEAQDDAVAGELSTSQIVNVLQALRETADPILVLTGGEPLARADFFDIAHAATARFTRVAMATNGTLVDAAVARAIAGSGIQRVSISFDGATPASHDAFRGMAGAFTGALTGLRALRAAGVSVQANVTITRHNVQEIAAILQVMLDEGADAFHVFLLVPVGCGAEIDPATRLTPAESEAVLRWLAVQSLSLRDRIQIKATCAPQYMRILRETARAAGIAPPTGGHGMQAVTRGCLAGSGVCFISRTGDVQPCGYLPLVVGNVLQQPLGEIWTGSADFAALRDLQLLTGKCGRCGYRVVCQGCRARAYAQTGDYLTEEPECPYQPPVAAGTGAGHDL